MSVLTGQDCGGRGRAYTGHNGQVDTAPTRSRASGGVSGAGAGVVAGGQEAGGNAESAISGPERDALLLGAIERLDLTPQQKEIVAMLIVDELSVGGAAYRLGVKYSSVRKQISRIYTRLGVETHMGIAKVVFDEVQRGAQTGAQDDS